MGRETTTLRREVVRLLLDLGLDPLPFNGESACLSEMQRGSIRRFFDTFPETGGGAVALGLPLRPSHSLSERAPAPPGTLPLERPADAAAEGSIGFWMAALAHCLRRAPVAARPDGGQPSPHDVRACLRHVEDGLERGAESVGSSLPRGASRRVAVLVWLWGLHEAFYEYLIRCREPRRFLAPTFRLETEFGILEVPADWRHADQSAAAAQSAIRAERALRERRAKVRKKVAEIAPCVLSRKTLSLLSREITLLLRVRDSRGDERK
jgi:hypothetical protein